MAKIIFPVLKALMRAMSYLRGCFLYLLINLCGGTCKGIPKVGRGVVFKYPPHGGITIGRFCDFGPFSMIDVPPTGVLKIGDRVKLTAGAFISAANQVTIGDASLIAEWVSIRDSEHQYAIDVEIGKQSLEIGKVHIGRDVWIGKSSTVLSNSTLKDGCIVGAHSLVKNCILEANSVYVGTPVRLVSNRG